MLAGNKSAANSIGCIPGSCERGEQGQAIGNSSVRNGAPQNHSFAGISKSGAKEREPGSSIFHRRAGVVRDELTSMTQAHPIAILVPLALGTLVIICSTVIHGLALSVTISSFRRERRLGRAGVNTVIDFAIVVVAIFIAFTAHLVEIGMWAWLFLLCGEFPDWGSAYYHSAVNYTTLGYGDIIMSPAWKLLGPLEAADGALMFGVSTAMVFAVTQRLFLTRYADLRE
jgi:hypothetical protein